MKKFFTRTIENIHLLIFDHEMSDRMRAFLANLSWSFFAGLVFLPLSMVILTLAGRFMGPEDFGKYNLVILISSYAVAFAFFGLDISTIKRISKAKTDREKEVSFFSTFVFIMFMLVFMSVMGLIFSPIIISKTNIPLTMIAFVVLFTFVGSMKSVLDILVRALERFKLQATGRMLEILSLVLGFVLVLVFYKKISFQIYLGIVIFSMTAIVIFYLKKLRKYFRHFSWEMLKIQLSEGKFFMLSAVAGTVFLSSDRFLIAKYLNVTALGVYSAYYTASLGLVTALSLILTNVFLPASAKTDDKKFTKKLDQLMIKGFVPIYLFICLAIFIFLKIFGKAYPLNLSYLSLFAFVASLYLFQIIYGVVMLDASKKDYIKYLFISFLITLVTVLYYFVLMKFLSKSITMLLIGFSINLIVNLIIQRLFLRQMREQTRVVPL